LSGGGTIAASRTFTVDLNELTTETSIADADFIAMVDATDDGSGKITFENLEDAIFASVSGDVLITEAGVSSIQANSVALTTDTTGHYVATITGGTGITSTAATTGEGTTHSLSVDASQTQITSVGTIGTGVWEGTTVAVAQGGTGATSLSNLITLGTHTTGNYVATLTAGALIDLQNNSGETASPTIDVDLTEAGEAAIANGDYILFLDGGATGTHAKEAIADVATLFAGTGLTATNSVIAIDAADTTTTSILNSSLGKIGTAAAQEYITFGTSDEVYTFINNTERLSVTANGADITGNLTVTSDLTVTGDTTTFSSANSQDPLVIIKNTTNDANGARLQLVKDKGAAGAANDVNGLIQFIGDDANEDQVTFSEIKSQVKVHTNGQEGGKFTVSVAEHDGTSPSSITKPAGDVPSCSATDTVNLPPS
jgi:hypothetical protein